MLGLSMQTARENTKILQLRSLVMQRGYSFSSVHKLPFYSASVFAYMKIHTPKP